MKRDINTYQVELDGKYRHPILVKDKKIRYEDEIGCYSSPEVIVKLMQHSSLHFARAGEEYLYLLCFDTSQHLLGVFEISHGIVNTTFARPREIYLRAILCGAAGIILVHNHPSGECTPSQADRDMSKNVKKIGDMMGIPLLDHIIIGESCFISMKEKGQYDKIQCKLHCKLHCKLQCKLQMKIYCNNSKI